MNTRLSTLKGEYQKLWDTCKINFDAIAPLQEIIKIIKANQSRYEKVAAATRCPWQFIACIHNMESSLNFNRHLHNGDSLKNRTVQVPAGRPAAFPINGWGMGYTWEESAIDALKLKDFHNAKDWSIPAQLWRLELYNGFGYRQYHPEILTPYLWSGTNHYKKGKYASDGGWNPSAISQQIGAAAIMQNLLIEDHSSRGNIILEITEDTFLKAHRKQAIDLPLEEKLHLPVGTTIKVDRYYREENHYHVVGDRMGWIYVGHCRVLENNALISTELTLQRIADEQITIDPEAIAGDNNLAKEIQSRLIKNCYLEPPADGKFGPISYAAFTEFQEQHAKEESGALGPISAFALLQDFRFHSLTLGTDFASKIIRYMLAKNYYVATADRHYNIVYIEGMNRDGTLNDDAPNCFNDLRIVIEFSNNSPRIVAMWEGTTEPGAKYTYSPMNPKGAARIQFGQYKAWSVGIHGTARPHEALVQVAPITVCRDFNKDFSRKGDRLDVGLFAVNQHGGFDFPKNDIRAASAGCLVGRTMAGHREFMVIVKGDRRYELNKNYVSMTTVIPGDDLVKMFPG